VISETIELCSFSKGGFYLLLPNWPKPTTLRISGILGEAKDPNMIIALVLSSL
jgi:hypothetical protein